MIVKQENKKRKATFVASMVMRKVFTDFKLWSCNIYINFSVRDIHAGRAPVASMVMHQPDELDLHGYLGSNPSWGGSAFQELSVTINNLQHQKVFAFCLGLLDTQDCILHQQSWYKEMKKWR